MVKCGCMPPMCKLLSVIDPKIIEVALEFLENSLELEAAAIAGGNSDAGGNGSDYRQLIRECGGLERLKRLATDSNPAIQARANEILQKHFAGKDNKEEQPSAVEE